MEELHKTSIGCHGNLKSTNVLVDSYWICKVADHGLHSFRENKLITEERLQRQSGTLICFLTSLKWQPSPPLNPWGRERETSEFPRVKLSPGDVILIYAFGMNFDFSLSRPLSPPPTSEGVDTAYISDYFLTNNSRIWKNKLYTSIHDKRHCPDEITIKEVTHRLRMLAGCLKVLF